MVHKFIEVGIIPSPKLVLKSLETQTSGFFCGLSGQGLWREVYYLCSPQPRQVGSKQCPLPWLSCVYSQTTSGRHRWAVYLDVINQAGPETARLKIIASPNIRCAPLLSCESKKGGQGGPVSCRLVTWWRPRKAAGRGRRGPRRDCSSAA